MPASPADKVGFTPTEALQAAKITTNKTNLSGGQGSCPALSSLSGREETGSHIIKECLGFRHLKQECLGPHQNSAELDNNSLNHSHILILEGVRVKGVEQLPWKKQILYQKRLGPKEDGPRDTFFKRNRKYVLILDVGIHYSK